MKILLTTLLLCISILADTINVSVSVDGKGYKAKKKAKKLAEKKAIQKYILNSNKNITDDIVSSVTDEYPEYILASTLQEMERDGKKSNFLYQVEVEAQLINKKLASLGQSIQGLSTNFIVVEEPLNLENIEFFSDQDFVIYYKILQQNIADIISSKMDDNGFKVSNIDTSRYKNSTGVYFDNDRSKYVKDKKFLKGIKKEHSSAIAIKYKVEFLTIIGNDIKATLSLKLEDISTNSSVSLGKLSYTIPMDNFSMNSIKDSFSKAIKNIVSLMLNDLTTQVSQIVQARNNQPVIVSINLKSKKVAFKIKREIKKDPNVFDIVIQNNNLKFYVKSDDAEEFLYDKLLPVVEDKLNKEIKDKYILINGKNITLNTDGKDFNNKNIRILFI
ncbi:MAG: hypothetical protein KAJ49_10240 [Arcobacteraceae bacterium]|nr:hypothetical protein [Arcobacteraceae bacterium]